MRSDRRSSLAKFHSKDVLRFAPNFSVYLLPPDVVCLFSEDRKFLLRGELYCALATTIGAGKGFGRIIRELSGRFPSDKIRDALTRLVDRHYVVRKWRSAAGVTAAYWASLGVPPNTAESNLQKCRVSIQSINVTGAKELAAALRSLGVRVVRRSADLTVTLVNDYLEAGLAELNRLHLSKHTSWLLVQPSGVFPLVGPLLRPHQGPCWTCLSDRMKRNREVKAHLDRTHARCVVASPLAHGTLGQSGIQLAAIEIAKAIASDFDTDLRDHIVSLDLLGPTIAKHYVAARPQCPTCGRKALRDPRRAPKPIRLAAGVNLTVTSGGYRTVSPAATLARHQKHVSPLTGVVSQLAPIEGDLLLNTNHFATHSFSAPAATVDELKAGLSGSSFGKGSTSEQGKASALMEAIERYSGIFQGDEIRLERRFKDFPRGDAIPANDILLFSEAQYRRDVALTTGLNETSTPAPVLFDRSAEIEWSPVWSLRDKRFKYLPTSLLYFFYRGGSPDSQFHADSNGCAAGNTIEEAIVQGFLELVERDSYAIWWYNRLRRPRVDLDQFDDPYIRDLQIQLAETGRRSWVLDVTSDLEIPSFVAVSHTTENSQEIVECGSGAHFDTPIALLRALTELSQFLSIRRMGGRNGHSPDNDRSFRMQDHPYLTPNGDAQVRSTFGPKSVIRDWREQVMFCVRLAERKGLDFLVLDQTRPDIGVPVARVIVPGLRHFYRRFAPGRLYDVPIRLGLRDKPLSEIELNPLHPRT